MNYILDELQDTVGGVKINTDFKACLQFFKVVTSDRDDKEKAGEILALFFIHGTPSGEVWDELEDFITAGEKGEAGRKTFDFEIDSGRIYTSFLQAYGIDLRQVKMHWHLFLELFRGLPEETALKKAIDIRTKVPGKHDSEEYKRSLRKAQDALRLDTPGLGALFGG